MNISAFDKVRGSFRAVPHFSMWEAEAECARCDWEYLELAIDSESEAYDLAAKALAEHLHAAHGVE